MACFLFFFLFFFFFGGGGGIMQSLIILATCMCTLILAVSVSHMSECKPATWLVVLDPELSNQQNQETARIVPAPFPLLGVGSGHETRQNYDSNLTEEQHHMTGMWLQMDGQMDKWINEWTEWLLWPSAYALWWGLITTSFVRPGIQVCVYVLHTSLHSDI